MIVFRQDVVLASGRIIKTAELFTDDARVLRRKDGTCCRVEGVTDDELESRLQSMIKHIET